MFNFILCKLQSYFIGYKTQTRLVKLDIIDENRTHIEVEFTCDFLEGRIGGTFDFTFKDEKAKADLIHNDFKGQLKYKKKLLTLDQMVYIYKIKSVKRCQKQKEPSNIL